MKSQQHSMDRRHFISSVGVLAGAFMLSPKSVFAQAESPVTMIIGEARKSPVVAKPLRGNLTLLDGSGGNIILAAGKKGNLLVDAGIDVSKDKMKAQISVISQAPLQYLINTHWHFDHASGNEWVHQAGAKIIAHANTRKRLSQTVRVEDWNYTFPPAPADALPAIVFEKEYMLPFEGETLQLWHYAPAHTDSDISVYFPDSDVLHVADTWWNGFYPFIDYNTGGSIGGMIKAADHNVSIAKDKTLIVPGHGPVGDKQQLTAYRDMLVAINDKVSKLKKSGMSLKEVIAAKPTRDYDAQWGNFVIGPDFFTKLVYKGVRG
ncbi:MBL fold metallo-hydrolase [Chitinophaga pinensis]|uniref:Beta-lactamase domain protein n=1 Tax=Chitinophaga pinensis (strain ATCC 43595 / DSM 2588 / LMG 13176 / NBRC 15968 / NCIMB 11800 / UQM 2034) TaxID=485918 RepID=A0A979GTX9_CHIPD|nr:MBL fold metallo-hydrolase [Chitinophaga pinensis]ACU60156.1 beta-lactamase domain protein [Chitinophaga pinensis DSM 2588]